MKLKHILEAILVDRVPTTPLLSESLDAIKQLGNRTLLTREFSQIKSGAAKISAESYEKGRIGLALYPKSPVYNEYVAKNFKALVNKFNLKYIIYYI